jgi:hypothetical protein
MVQFQPNIFESSMPPVVWPKIELSRQGRRPGDRWNFSPGRFAACVFVYRCFDRIVVHAYLSGLSRPEQAVHSFRDVIGAPAVDKPVLSKQATESALDRFHPLFFAG